MTGGVQPGGAGERTSRVPADRCCFVIKTCVNIGYAVTAIRFRDPRINILNSTIEMAVPNCRKNDCQVWSDIES